jgi:hypothetical protein
MRVTNRTWPWLVAAVGAVAIISSCYPGDPLTVSEADVVVTAFGSEVDFADYQTYALADSVVHLVADGDDDDITRAYDSQRLASVKSKMDALGFTEVVDPAAADVIMAVAVSASDYTSYYSYSPCYYYCWYYPYPSGWGWYYPPYVGGYSYTVGTIFINMIERIDPTGDEDQIQVAWVAALNGVSDSGSNASRIQAAINQAFEQSKYLGAGK